MNGTIGKICKNEDCPEKGKKQPYDNFSKHIGYSDGLYPECKKCFNKKNKEHQKKKREERDNFFKTFM